jgi:hypothetical protein
MIYPRSKPISRPHTASPSPGRTADANADGGPPSPGKPQPSKQNRPESAPHTRSRDIHKLAEVDQTMHVMKMIYEATGNQIRPSGHSQFDTLGQLSVMPALSVLRHKRWVDFFSAMKNSNGVSEPSTVQKSGSKSLSAIPSFQSAKSEATDENKLNAEETFKILKKRVIHLWKELKVPKSDIDFYSYNLLRQCDNSMEQFADISKYLTVLNSYRLSTSAVIREILNREHWIATLLDTLNQVNRRKTNLSQMKTEVLRNIVSVQISTVNVIHQIQNWRSNFWRPLPFQ